ncbi:MAG: NAD-glutamate dehydrogenase, partial [Burkholderiales bacterium]|nr:NAD-glutamate dehydrogenase [Burkholderiales bacterium]
MTTSHLAELLAYAQEHTGSAADRQAGFVAAYFENTDPDEVQARGSATLFAVANAHWRLLDAPRAANSAKLRVFNPTLAEDGFVSEHTVIQIVNDNMPFLVDSVTMAINRSGRTAHWIVHPLMSVARDAQGGIAAVSTVATANAAGKQDKIESLILVECDRIVAVTEQQALADELSRVLADVRGAVDDWPAMLARVQSVTQAAEKSPLSPANREEGIAFLHWMEARHFTFLGARDYDLKRDGDSVTMVARPDTGLGILRGAVQTIETVLSPEAVALVDSDELVLVTKTMTRATVHRPAWLDYIGVKRFDEAGQVIGESRFLGLYTSTAYSCNVADIPQVRQRAADVMSNAGVVPDSHAAKSLQSILDDYPRDELFQIDTATLTEHAVGILRLQERQRTRLFLRRDPFGRFTSAQVFVPRDRYNTELRVKISTELMAALNGQSIEFTPMLTDSPLARIHYLVRAKEHAPHNVNLQALEARIAKLAQRWEDDCSTELLRAHGEGHGLALAHHFANAFSTPYREDFSALVAAEDADMLANLTANSPLAVKLYRPLDAAPGMLRFKIYNTSKVALSDSLPVLERMGARVLDEHPYHIASANGNAGESLWIHDLGLQLPPSTDLSTVKARFEALFALAWGAQVESDDLNRLVLSTALDARAIAVLRAYTRYFKQLGFAFSQSYIEATLNKNASIAQAIAELFDARFNPTLRVDRDAEQLRL